jgi:aspartate kinase
VIVMKFGGTSVGSAERMRGVAARARERLAEQPVVVVSALAGVTDLLIRGAGLALERDPLVEAVIQEVLQRHRDVVAGLLPHGTERGRLLDLIEAIGSELRTLYVGVHHLGELSPRSLDAISGMGERLSFEIAAAALRQEGLPARGVDAREVIVTDEGFGRAVPLWDLTSNRVQEILQPLLREGTLPVLPGFIGRTRRGVSTTLGRGGSDWSAAILGACLPADEIQIWTDVDGMMTADPRSVPEARVIPEVTFDEAAELAYFGAKVLHPATIKPAVERGIPVRVLNALNPSAPGTVIRGAADGSLLGPRAVAFKKGISVVLISQPRMLMAYGFVARVFEVFERHHTPVDLIATSEVSISLTVDQEAALPAIQADLQALGEVRLLRPMAIVSLVGQGFLRRAGLAGRIFQALSGVNVVMISFGASDVNISLVVAEEEAVKAARALHREFFEGAA